jgi:hypothetical protein
MLGANSQPRSNLRLSTVGHDHNIRAKPSTIFELKLALWIGCDRGRTGHDLDAGMLGRISQDFHETLSQKNVNT